MSNETIVRVTVDASGYQAGMEKAKRSAEAFIASQEQAAKITKAQQDAITEAVANGVQKQERTIASFVKSTMSYAEVVGKTKSQQLEMKAAQLGVSEAMSGTIAKIREVEQAAHAGGHAMEEFSFKTAGAKRELLVLAHEASQGNWKRFAGSLMVLGERTNVMGTLMSPIGLGIGIVVAGLAALAIAAVKGAEEENRFNQAIMMTGNYAGTTRAQMESMASAIAASGGKISTAKEVMLSLAESGRFTGGQIAAIGPAAAAMASVTGMAVKDVVKEFQKLAEEPVKASVKLNEHYHYLTLAVYDQIAALEKQGDAVGAASVAEKTWADAANERIHNLQSNLGYLERAWHGVGDAASAAWSKMMGFGKTETTEGKIASLQNWLKQQQDYLGFSPDTLVKDTAHQVALLQEKLRFEQRDAERQSQVAQMEQGKIAARVWMDGFHKEFASQAEKRRREIEEYTRNADKLGAAGPSQAQRAADIAAINEKYKDHAGHKPNEFHDDAATRFIQQLRDQDAAVRASLEANDKLAGAEKQQAEFLQKIADLKEKKILTVDQKSLLAAQDQINAQLALNVEHERALKLKEDIQKVDERGAQVRAHIVEMQRTQNDAYARELGAFGLGTDAQKQVQAINAITKAYEQLQWQLEKQTPKSARGSPEYLQAQADIQAGLDKSIKDYEAYYATLKEKQEDWVLGAQTAVANFLDAQRNMAAQTEKAVSGMAKSMEDSIIKFVTTGKINFTSLADSIMADITRIAVRLMEQQALSGIFSLIGGSFGNGFATFAANSMPGDALDNLIGLTGGWGTVPGRATGGDVDANSMYWVGEKGPELFVPSASGSIVPNHAIRSVASNDSGPRAGDRTNNFNMNITVPAGTSRATAGQQAFAIMRQANIAMARG